MLVLLQEANAKLIPETDAPAAGAVLVLPAGLSSRPTMNR
jgi:hypothetical protein